MKRICDLATGKVGQIVLTILITLSAFIGAYANNSKSSDVPHSNRTETRKCFLSNLRDHETEAQVVKVFSDVRQITELRDGYDLCFRGTEEEIRTLIDFVLYERNCCTFLTLGFVLESEKRSVRLQLRGGSGVKVMIKMLLPENMGIRPYEPGGAG